MGTVPNARGNIHAFDLRMMVGAEPGGGFFPVAIYARRARRALPETLVAGASSWDILGTNLSIKARPRCRDVARRCCAGDVFGCLGCLQQAHRR